MPPCPICKKPVEPMDDPRHPNRYYPFCGERCKLIDLGRWLGEKYGIPISRPSGSSDASVRQNQHGE